MSDWGIPCLFNTYPDQSGIFYGLGGVEATELGINVRDKCINVQMYNWYMGL